MSAPVIWETRNRQFKFTILGMASQGSFGAGSLETDLPALVLGGKCQAAPDRGKELPGVPLCCIVNYCLWLALLYREGNTHYRVDYLQKVMLCSNARNFSLSGIFLVCNCYKQV